MQHAISPRSVGRFRDIVTKSYLACYERERQQNQETADATFERASYWTSMNFDRPVTFATLAMEQGRKEDIVEDLLTFSKAKDIYRRIGK